MGMVTILMLSSSVKTISVNPGIESYFGTIVGERDLDDLKINISD
jgi:hypothetical protein